MYRDTISDVAVIGAGRMGHGIALTFALADRAVRLYDVDGDVLASSKPRIDDVLETLVDAGRITAYDASVAHSNLTCVDSFEAAVTAADFVTEAVAEDLAVKQAVFEDLDDHASADAILATNTSSLSLEEITTHVEDRRRVLGTHWFNPAYLVPLVEIVNGEETTQETVERVHDLLESAGKTPIVVQKDIPGFIGNRIQAAMSYEAFSLLARGVATAEDIDKAVKAGFGFRLPFLGVFEKMDQSNLAIHHMVEEQLMGDLDRGTEPNQVIEELLDAGHTGSDSGKGVYDWSDVDLDAVYQARDRALIELLDLYEETDAASSPPPNYDRT